MGHNVWHFQKMLYFGALLVTTQPQTGHLVLFVSQY